ncbi:unnamed protein product [Amoebophrya sp. A120]|nr:unnamed protein product [Amoebophrya sp. A120]|eukprot:GSA120T00018906001.1
MTLSRLASCRAVVLIFFRLALVPIKSSADRIRSSKSFSSEATAATALLPSLFPLQKLNNTTFENQYQNGTTSSSGRVESASTSGQSEEPSEHWQSANSAGVSAQDLPSLSQDDDRDERDETTSIPKTHALTSRREGGNKEVVEDPAVSGATTGGPAPKTEEQATTTLRPPALLSTGTRTDEQPPSDTAPPTGAEVKTHEEDVEGSSGTREPNDSPASSSSAAPAVHVEAASATESGVFHPSQWLSNETGAIFFRRSLQLVFFAYAFVGLALAADHLCNSMETLCTRNKVPEDVAGASFMAFGSAIPEITVNAISTYRSAQDQTEHQRSNDVTYLSLPRTTRALTKESAFGEDIASPADLGVGGILGSGFIAFLLIPTLCVWFAPKREANAPRALFLKRGVLRRDVFFYAAALLVLNYALHEREASCFSAVSLLLLYVSYLGMLVRARRQFLRGEDDTGTSSEPRQVGFISVEETELSQLASSSRPGLDPGGSAQHQDHIQVVDSTFTRSSADVGAPASSSYSASVPEVLSSFLSIGSDSSTTASVTEALISPSTTRQLPAPASTDGTGSGSTPPRSQKATAPSGTRNATDYSLMVDDKYAAIYDRPVCGAPAAQASPLSPESQHTGSTGSAREAAILRFDDAEEEDLIDDVDSDLFYNYEEINAEDVNYSAPTRRLRTCVLVLSRRCVRGFRRTRRCCVRRWRNYVASSRCWKGVCCLGPGAPPSTAASRIRKGLHLCLLPVEFGLRVTCPDCRAGEVHERYYAVTFFVSFSWISFFSYIVTDVSCDWVDALQVPSLMAFFGLCLVAVGAEIPDTINSVTVAKRGLGSMAVSACVGSQIANICLGLGCSWLVAVLVGGEPVEIGRHDYLVRLAAKSQLLNVFVFYIVTVVLASRPDGTIVIKGPHMFLFGALYVLWMTLFARVALHGRIFE